MRRGGLITGIVAATAAAGAASAAVVADRRVRALRRPAIEALGHFTPPEPARAGYVNADDGVRIYYEEDGPADAPLTVVLVHGFSLNHDDLLFQRRALLERFGDGIRVLSFDHRSHGRSGRSAADHAVIDQLGRDLHGVLAALAPSGPLVLVGHSMGGMTILALADSHPAIFAERVAGVALLDTSTGNLGLLSLGVPAALGGLSGPAVRLAVTGVRSQGSRIERARARFGDAAWYYVKRLAFGPDVDAALVEFLAQMIAATPVDVLAEFLPTFTTHDKLTALTVLTGVPVVLICGEDDVITPPEHTRVMATRLPDAEVVWVPDSGHQALMERPDVVNPPLVRLVEKALAR